jgi:PAS domain-containing protein
MDTKTVSSASEESVQRLRVIFEYSSAGLMVVSDGRATMVNEAFARMLPVVHVRGETFDRDFVFEGRVTYSYTVFSRRSDPLMGSDATTGREL